MVVGYQDVVTNEAKQVSKLAFFRVIHLNDDK